MISVDLFVFLNYTQMVIFLQLKKKVQLFNLTSLEHLQKGEAGINGN